MWMWLIVKFSIYHTFIASLLIKIIFWDEKFQINHMISNIMVQTMWNDMVQYTFNFHKNQKSFQLFLEYICVFEYTSTLHLFPQIYSNLPLYKMKWNNSFFNILPLGYILTFNAKILWNSFKSLKWDRFKHAHPLENNIMWHPKGGHYSVLSPYIISKNNCVNAFIIKLLI
jgi:hypothetical protein